MNGRIERTDARLALWSEPNYHALEFFLREQRMAKYRKTLHWAGVVLANVAYWVYLWVRP